MMTKFLQQYKAHELDVYFTGINFQYKIPGDNCLESLQDLQYKSTLIFSY